MITRPKKSKPLAFEQLDSRVVPSGPGTSTSVIGPFIPGQPPVHTGPLGPETVVLHGRLFAHASMGQFGAPFRARPFFHFQTSPFRPRLAGNLMREIRAGEVTGVFGPFRPGVAPTLTGTLGPGTLVLHSPAFSTGLTTSPSGTITFNPSLAFVNHFA